MLDELCGRPMFCGGREIKTIRPPDVVLPPRLRRDSFPESVGFKDLSSLEPYCSAPVPERVRHDQLRSASSLELDAPSRYTSKVANRYSTSTSFSSTLFSSGLLLHSRETQVVVQYRYPIRDYDVSFKGSSCFADTAQSCTNCRRHSSIACCHSCQAK